MIRSDSERYYYAARWFNQYCLLSIHHKQGVSCIAVKVSSGRDGQFEAMLAPVLRRPPQIGLLI